MKVQESKENYLEAIYMLSKEKPHVRAVDVARMLDFTKASVSVALANLRGEGLVRVDDVNCLYLTEPGEAIAKQVFERHTVIKDLLIKIGVDHETAADDACRIEHVISGITFDKLKAHIGEMKK